MAYAYYSFYLSYLKIKTLTLILVTLSLKLLSAEVGHTANFCAIMVSSFTKRSRHDDGARALIEPGWAQLAANIYVSEEESYEQLFASRAMPCLRLLRFRVRWQFHCWRRSLISRDSKTSSLHLLRDAWPHIQLLEIKASRLIYATFDDGRLIFGHAKRASAISHFVNFTSSTPL